VDLRLWEESQSVQHAAESFHCRVVVVGAGQSQRLYLTIGALAQVEKAPTHCDTGAKLAADGVHSS